MTDPELPDNVLSGAFYRLGTVDDDIDDATLDDIKDGSEEPTYIGNTHDGFDTDVDWEEFDVNPSTGAVTQQYRTHRAYTLSCGTFATPGLEQLEDAGFVDTTTGKVTPSAKVGGVVVEVFDHDPREAVNNDGEVETIVYPNAQLTIDGIEYGESDAGEYPLEILVNDDFYVMSYRADPA